MAPACWLPKYDSALYSPPGMQIRGGSTGSQTGCNLKTGTWRHGMADAAWLHFFWVWTSHCLYLGLYLDYAYPCSYACTSGVQCIVC